MAGVTTAVISTGLGIAASERQASARREAAREQEEAARLSAETLGRAGKEAQKKIRKQSKKAVKDVAQGIQRAEEEILPFAEGSDALLMAREAILSGSPLSGGIAESVAGAANLPSNVFATMPGSEERQRQLAVSAVTPAFRQAQFGAGQQGLAAVGDIAGLRSGGATTIADILEGQGAQRASAIVGATPQLLALQQQGQEARLLGNVAQQNFQSDAIGQLSRLAGQLREGL